MSILTLFCLHMYPFFRLLLIILCVCLLGLVKGILLFTLIYHSYLYFMKSFTNSLCLNSLKPFDIKYNFRRFDTMKDIISYCYEELDILFDLEKELPYKFIMIKNSEGNYKNIIVFKVDHNLADGLGFIGLITALGENYSLNLFPVR